MLDLKTSVIQIDKANAKIYDVTGLYSAGSNPGGWDGGGNPAPSDVTAATLEVWSNLYPTPVVIDLLQGGTIAYEDTDIYLYGMLLTSQALFASAKFEDGVYFFQLNLTALGQDYSYTNSMAFIANIRCCIQKKGMNIKFPVTNAQYQINTAFAISLLDVLIWAGCCGQVEYFLEVKAYLDKYCEGCGESVNDSVVVPCGCN